jgi:hypothetical protein
LWSDIQVKSCLRLAARAAADLVRVLKEHDWYAFASELNSRDDPT